MSWLHFPVMIILLLSSVSESKLSLDYYQKTCPDFQKLVRETITSKQIESPTTAAGLLRVFFHDCIIDGCDASMLITSNSFNQAERDAEDNLNLPGDAFDVITRAKTALELTCPNVVSCADIMAQATRDLVTMVGGPFYRVALGRKDSLISRASIVAGHLPRANMTVDYNLQKFISKGFTAQELVALVGSHTIGFSHCKQFSKRLFNFSETTPTDPDLNPKYADALKKLCANYTEDPTMSAFNDVYTPGKFDNMYYQNLQKGLGLLASDNAFIKDPRTKPFVERYANDQSAFFKDFAAAMEKLSVLGVKEGNDGEIRRRCDVFNTIKT